MGWNLPENDELFRATLLQVQTDLRAAALRLGEAVEGDFMYNNYSPPDTPLERMYGGNVERLREIKRTYDPNNVMGLAGGFKF